MKLANRVSFVSFKRIPASYLKSRFSDICRRLLEAIAKYATTESTSLLKSVSDKTMGFLVCLLLCFFGHAVVSMIKWRVEHCYVLYCDPCYRILWTQKLESHVLRAELKGSSFKAWSRSKYSHACFTYCQRFFPGSNFYLSGLFTFIFSKTLKFFLFFSTAINCGLCRLLCQPTEKK